MRWHELRQPEPVHHPSGDRGHLRRRHLDALDRHRGRHGDLGEGRQRLRRRRGDRVHPAGGRAASQRPGRRRAGHRLRRAARQAGSDLRPGPGAGRRDDRALSPRGSRPRPRHRAPCRLRARHLRDLDAAAARLRHALARRGARARDRLCAERPSAARARQRHHRHGRRTVPRALADVGRGLSSERRGAAGGNAVRQQTARGDLSAHPQGSRERRRRPHRPRSNGRAKPGRRASSPKRSAASAAPRK